MSLLKWSESDDDDDDDHTLAPSFLREVRTNGSKPRTATYLVEMCGFLVMKCQLAKRKIKELPEIQTLYVKPKPQISYLGKL